MDAEKQLRLKAKKESSGQMAPPAPGSLSVKQLDAMATARKKQQAAASAQAQASDDWTEDGDPQAASSRHPSAMIGPRPAVPPPTPTVPLAVNAVATPAQRLKHNRRGSDGDRSLPPATPRGGDRVADGAESGPPSGEKRKATSAGGSPPDAGGKPKKAQMKSGKVDQILKE